MRNPDPRGNQKAGVVSQKMQIFFRTWALHPIKRSLGPRCQGAEDHARQAMALLWEKATYLRCSPTGWL